MTHLIPLRPRRGLTLAELLVVLAIISLVAIIAIPTVTTQMERARISSAAADVRALAMAEEVCASIHGLYVPLQVLDDLPDPLIASGTDVDRIDLESTSIRLIDPLIPARLQIASAPPQPLLSTTDPRGRQLIRDWAGPFIEFRRATNTPNPQSQSDQRRDFPYDPWGQPYRFLSDEGAIGTGQAVSDNEVTDLGNLTENAWGNGQLTTQLDRFDRYTILSTGRDLMVDQFNVLGQQGDDIVRNFGIVGFETGFLSRFPARPINTVP